MHHPKQWRRRSALQAIATVPVLAAPLATPLAGASPDRPWLGPEFWANPLQDWRRHNDRFECHVSGGDRNVFWLTRELAPRAGGFVMSVRLGRLDDGVKGPGYAGFRIGVQSWFRHYKDAAVRGVGLDAGLTNDGRLFIGEVKPGAPAVDTKDATLTLTLSGRQLELRCGASVVTAPDSWVAGGVALVCSTGEPAIPEPIAEPVFATAPKPRTARGGNTRYWFQDWTLTGAKVQDRSERAWGPILFNQYTLSRGVMRMTVQLAPVEAGVGKVELHNAQGKIAEAAPDPQSHTAHFRVAGWNENEATPYTVIFQNYRHRGTIAANPRNKPKITAGSLTCQNDFGYPHDDVARNLVHAKPDILFFTGDQVYERNGEYGIQRGPAEAARLDYLRKWYLFGWAWGHLTKDIPCVCLCDDHDVYHGNIWGAGGRKAEYPDGDRQNQQGGQDSGGYTMPADWVNLVQRTQSSHLPDAFDPTPVDQNITVYYTSLDWGGISFALLEDRKFKSAPASLLPGAKIRNGWIKNPAFDSATQGDVPGANLLGDRQEKFLEVWARDWSRDTWMKCAVSATIFANLATLPASATDDSVTQKLPVQKLGTYAPNEKKTQDHDSNGWPQTPRNRAVKLLRSCQAVHLAGDQHLGSLIQYGVDEHNDGVHALCAPAISNLFPRRWFPPNGQPLGEHLDGFGNRVTVRAVANPFQFGITPAALHERACGFSIVEFERATRRITLTNWPRWADLTRSDAKAYPGWPVTIHQMDNGLNTAAYVLPLKQPVKGLVEVASAKGERAYTLRLAAAVTELPVWNEGVYRVRTEAGRTIDVTATKRVRMKA